MNIIMKRNWKTAIVTLSDKGYAGEREDLSGPLIRDMIMDKGYEVSSMLLLPDEQELIEKKLIELSDVMHMDLILTTGGTGLSKRDCTPEATLAVATKNAPGIAQAMRYESLQITPRAMLSRGVSVIRGETLIINLPGSPKAVKENLECILSSLPHGLEIMRGMTGECGSVSKDTVKDCDCLKPDLTSDERYTRQIAIEGMGEEGQKRLKNASVLVIGAGGLGCPVIASLAEAGVGRIGIVDKDCIELSNLNRQFLYTPADIGKQKANAAGDWVQRFRPDCRTDIYHMEVNRENISDLIREYDILLLALDSVKDRMVVNEAACRAGKPFVDGAVDGLYGVVLTRVNGQGPCITCLNPGNEEPVRKCRAFGPVTMLIGSVQAQAALLYLAGFPVRDGVQSYDAMSRLLEEVPVKVNPHCKICTSGLNEETHTIKEQRW